MGEKDLCTKYIEAYNDVFADIFNVLVFHEDYLEESLLVDGPTETQYKTETGDLHAHHRDCMKYYKDMQLSCVTFGIEESMLLDKQEGKVITMCNFAERMEQKGIQIGRQEGIQEGRREGRREGESLLADAIRALKSGKTVEELLHVYNKHTLDLAQEFV